MKKTNLLPSEVFKLIQSTRDLKERDAIIQKHADFTIRTILQVNFNDWIKLDLPEGKPPFTPDTNPVDKSGGRIHKLIRNLKILTPASNLKKYKKEVRFIQMLESVNQHDAEILIAMKDKALTKLYSAITEAFVRRNFPKLIVDKNKSPKEETVA